jgi:AGCS family alanine or glycine:cation symporter
MGNVAGVAVAITQGGPGAIFWMWVCALLGMATKFYTCSLAVMYRGKDENGVEQGGPMYFIREGLGGEMETFGYLLCRLRDVWLFAPFAIKSIDSDCKHDVF